MSRLVSLPLLALAVLLTLVGCGGSGDGSDDAEPNPTPTPTVTKYRGTAAVGDFILIDIDHGAGTISYDNISNGETGTVAFTEHPDGSYTVHTPSGDVPAFEIEGFGMVLELPNTGPGGSTASLVVAVVGNDPVTVSQLENIDVNVMQFRTVGDGIEIAHATSDSVGDIEITAYRPSEPLASAFHNSTGAASDFTVDPSGLWLNVDEGGGAVSRVVTTPSGLYFIDNPNGAQIALPAPASKAFQTVHAGTYRTIVYEKKNASSPAPGLPETGTAQFHHVELTITPSGHISATDPTTGTLLIDTLALTPVADDPDLYDGSAAKLQDPCHGLFVFQATGGAIGPSQKSFVAFMDDALAIASYEDNGDGTYSYFYGYAMRLPTGMGAADPAAADPGERLAGR